MAEGKKGFMLYADQKVIFDKLPDDLAGKLIKLIFSYVNDENPSCDDLLLEIAFAPIRQQLKRDLQKYVSVCEKRRNAGLKGGRPKGSKKNQKKPIGFSEKQTKHDIENDNDNDTDNDKEIKKKNVTQKKKFVIPTIQEITAYCEERSNGIDPNRFLDHYISNGWMVGKTKMKDWKAAVRTWERKDKSSKKPWVGDNYSDSLEF